MTIPRRRSGYFTRERSVLTMIAAFKREEMKNERCRESHVQFINQKLRQTQINKAMSSGGIIPSIGLVF